MHPTIDLIQLLDGIFTTSFKHTAAKLYKVEFEADNVIFIQQRLQQLQQNVASDISTGIHVGYLITIDDVRNVIETLERLVATYKDITHLATVPSNLKLRDMISRLRESTADAKQLTKEALNEFFTRAPIEAKKLNKKEQMDADAEAMSAERNRKRVLKHGLN